MFKKDQLETPPDKVNTVIGKDTHFQGSLKAKGLIRIDGVMEGDVETQGDVVIGESGRVSLELKARNVAVAGRFEGTMDLGASWKSRVAAWLSARSRQMVYWSTMEPFFPGM